MFRLKAALLALLLGGALLATARDYLLLPLRTLCECESTQARCDPDIEEWSVEGKGRLGVYHVRTYAFAVAGVTYHGKSVFAPDDAMTFAIQYLRSDPGINAVNLFRAHASILVFYLLLLVGFALALHFARRRRQRPAA